MLAVDSEVERVTEVTAWARGETHPGGRAGPAPRDDEGDGYDETVS